MKLLLTLLLSVISFSVNAQYFWQENFESPYDMNRGNFYIDTVNYHHNIWEIGKPDKIVFDSAYSLPNAIITDTLHTYPASNTSVFYVYCNTITGGGVLNFSFWYKLDIDSGVIVKVEVSGDRGLNWINTLTQDTTYLFDWGAGGGKPRMDTSILSWKQYNVDMGIWANAYPGGPDTFPHYITSDTVMFRFTFISDSDTAIHKDGWMMDNFMFEGGFMEGVVNKINAIPDLTIYPNPSSGYCYIAYEGTLYDDEKIVVYGLNGKVIYTTKMPLDHILELPDLSDGVYILKFINTDGSYFEQRVIVEK